MTVDADVSVHAHCYYELSLSVPDLVAELAIGGIKVRRQQVAMVYRLKIDGMPWDVRQQRFDTAIEEIVQIFRTIDSATDGALDHLRICRIAMVPNENAATLALTASQLQGLASVSANIHLDAFRV